MSRLGLEIETEVTSNTKGRVKFRSSALFYSLPRLGEIKIIPRILEFSCEKKNREILGFRRRLLADARK